MSKYNAKLQFSDKVKREIYDRDNGRCAFCSTPFNLESVPHHIYFKSQMGLGIAQNGITVCRTCHDKCHGKVNGVNQHAMRSMALSYLTQFYNEEELTRDKLTYSKWSDMSENI